MTLTVLKIVTFYFYFKTKNLFLPYNVDMFAWIRLSWYLFRLSKCLFDFHCLLQVSIVCLNFEINWLQKGWTKSECTFGFINKVLLLKLFTFDTQIDCKWSILYKAKNNYFQQINILKKDISEILNKFQLILYRSQRAIALTTDKTRLPLSVLCNSLTIIAPKV